MLVASALLAAARAQTADQIIERAREANRIESSIQTVRMTIDSGSGAVRVREVELRSRRDGEITKTCFQILAPSDVAGTRLLLIDNPGRLDEQLLYLPSYKRVNFVSGSARRGSFVGSDFAYEDFEVREAAVGTHRLVEETPEDWVVETVLTGESSYTRIEATIRKADLVVRRIGFYDPSGLIKVLEVKRVAEEGGVHLPVETEMTNVQKGTSTRLEIVAHRLDLSQEELPDETFTRAWLERGG